VEWIGHRGAPREALENTTASFEMAFARGAEAVELDVHTTVDGVVVVHHDPNLGLATRPPPLRGRALADMTWSELRSADLGRGERIPSLSDVLRLTPSHATVYVELKGRSIERAVADVIMGAPVRCAVHSFDHDAIRTMSSLAPEVPRGILFDSAPVDVAGVMRHAAARDVWPKWTLIDRALVDAIHAAGGRVIAWTVNSRDVARELSGLGVDAICSDDLRVLR